MNQDREDGIRARAHQLWEAAGRPLGQDGEHWRRATEEVDAKMAGASRAPRNGRGPAVGDGASGAASSAGQGAREAAHPGPAF